MNEIKENNIEELKCRVLNLEQKLKMLTNFMDGENIKKNLTKSTVNGEDFSNATHEEAVAAFQTASEPITVVMSRSQKSVQQLSKSKVDSSTQTDLPCSCNFNSPYEYNNSLSALLSFQTMLKENSLMGNELTGMSSSVYEKVILQRTSPHEKLGLTLFNDIDHITQEEKVVVKEVHPQSIAGRCRNIRQGDHIIKINESLVTDMHEARSLLESNSSEITFLISRQTETPAYDVEAWSDEGVIYDEIDFEEHMKKNEGAEPHINTANYSQQSNDHSDTFNTKLDYTLSSFTNTNSKDSGFGQTDSSILNSESSTLRSLLTAKDGKSCDLYDEYRKHGTGRFSIDSIDSAKGSMASPVSPLSPQIFSYDLIKESKLHCVSESKENKPRRSTNISNLSHAKDDTTWVLSEKKKCDVEHTAVFQEDRWSKDNFSENCSSAYSTSESFHSLIADIYQAKRGVQLVFKEPDFCVSSDANSDPDDIPTWYMTQEGDNIDSDGFEDASFEFTRFDNSSGCNLSNTRRNSGFDSKVNRKQKLSRSSSAPTSSNGVALKSCTFEALAEEDESAENIKRNEMNHMMANLQCKSQEKTSKCTKLKHRNDNIAYKSRKIGKKIYEETSCGTDTTTTSNMEWKVKIRSDGSRYITKRPIRERLLKEREAKLNKERCGMTTDDDAMTELKLGKHWTRGDRKKHLERAKEYKKRKEFMERCRADLVKAATEEDILKISHKKMTKKKNRRVLDDFMTVQEILAHGDRFLDSSKKNPLLNVTYI